MFDENKLNKYVKTTPNGASYFQFDTLYELGDLCSESVEAGYVSDAWEKGSFGRVSSRKSYIVDSGGFQGTRTFDEAIDLLKYGWEHGAQKINAKIKTLSSNKTLLNRYSVEGGNVCVPRAIIGHPLNMIKATLQEKPVKVLNVYKSAGYNGVYSEDKIIENSAKALQIVELLERSGYRVNLFVCKLNKDDTIFGTEYFFTKVKIKSASERLNIKRTAFCLANPAFQRRILWRLIELAPWLKGYWDEYGVPIDNGSRHSMHLKYKEYINDKNMVFIPIVIDDVDSFVKNLKIEN